MKPISFEAWKANNPDIESEACEMCKGEKWIACPDCDDDNFDDCTKCGGEGSLTCYDCKGDGTTLQRMYREQVRSDLRFLRKRVPS